MVVYFYPAAMTPAATPPRQSTSRLPQQLLGSRHRCDRHLSGRPEKLAAFRQRKGLKITLLSDESRQTLDAYGAWGAKKSAVRQVHGGSSHSTFVIDVDEDGVGRESISPSTTFARPVTSTACVATWDCSQLVDWAATRSGCAGVVDWQAQDLGSCAARRGVFVPSRHKRLRQAGASFIRARAD